MRRRRRRRKVYSKLTQWTERWTPRFLGPCQPRRLPSSPERPQPRVRRLQMVSLFNIHESALATGC